ncbi:hypothetical protein [Mesorhizobium sp. L-8-3]|uniref:hypothetical protein n=1 Tax=Mesorhizobium sp. L-8-3 TaxID=2744522 RepID=UPI001927EFE6|nr:hypothetical protein [Mesorhizobium sp. L-8-3]BCH25771.1 hypothetical protein MesoLjLb_55560 [Mesorhizobium sp. L-8-3]
MTREQIEALARARLRLEQEQAQPSVAADVARSAGAGLSQGVTGLADMALSALIPTNPVATVQSMVRGELPENRPMVEPTRQGMAALTGGATEYDPQTTAGEYARTIGEFAPNALAPGGLVRRGAMVLAPAVASEGLGQATEGTFLETPARMAGALAGGLTAAGVRRETVRVVKQASKYAEISSGDEMRRHIRSAYDQMREAGFSYNGDRYADMLARTKAALLKQGFHPSNAAKAHGILDDLMKSPALDFGALDAQSSGIGKTIRSLYKQGNDAEASAMEAVKTALDDFAVNPQIVAEGGTMSARELASMRSSARAMVLRQKKAEAVEQMIELADASQSGFVQGLNNEIAKELRKAATGKSMFTPTELNLLRSVQTGKTEWRKMLFLFGASADALGGGVGLTAGAIERSLSAGGKRTRMGQLATAMRNQELETIARDAGRETRRQALRRLMAIGQTAREATE